MANVTPAGCPVTVTVAVPLNPPEPVAVAVMVALAPCAIDPLVGLSAIAREGLPPPVVVLPPELLQPSMRTRAANIATQR